MDVLYPALGDKNVLVSLMFHKQSNLSAPQKEERTAAVPS